MKILDLLRKGKGRFGALVVGVIFCFGLSMEIFVLGQCILHI